MAEDTSEVMMEGPADDQKDTADVEEASFSKVRRKRKRGKDMEVDDTGTVSAPKKPVFPPVDASTTLVHSGLCLLRSLLKFQSIVWV